MNAPSSKTPNCTYKRSKKYRCRDMKRERAGPFDSSPHPRNKETHCTSLSKGNCQKKVKCERKKKKKKQSPIRFATFSEKDMEKLYSMQSVLRFLPLPEMATVILSLPKSASLQGVVVGVVSSRYSLAQGAAVGPSHYIYLPDYSLTVVSKEAYAQTVS